MQMALRRSASRSYASILAQLVISLTVFGLHPLENSFLGILKHCQTTHFFLGAAIVDFGAAIFVRQSMQTVAERKAFVGQGVLRTSVFQFRGLLPQSALCGLPALFKNVVVRH